MNEAPGFDAAGAAGDAGTLDADTVVRDPVWLPRGALLLTANELERKLAIPFGVAAPAPDIDLQPTRLYTSVEVDREAPPDALRANVQQLLDTLTNAEILEVVGCSDPDVECATLASSEFASKVLGRPTSDAERASLMQEYEAVTAGGGSWNGALRAELRALLAFPELYWLPAFGVEVEPGVYRLSDEETALLLSYSLTAGPPDEQLEEAAESGLLQDPVERRAQARRLLGTADAEAVLMETVRSWFGVLDFDQLTPLLESALEQAGLDADAEVLATSMLGETDRLIEHVILSENKPATSILAADYSFIDETLGELYGLTTASAGFGRVSLTETPRRGLLSHASWLASTSRGTAPSYAERSVHALGALCERFPPEPTVGPIVEPAIFEEDVSRRERMETMTAPPECQGCHGVLDPIAFAFDHFDALGVYQELELGLPIDTSGRLTSFEGHEFDFQDSAELIAQMAATGAFAECFVRKSIAWVTGADAWHPAADSYLERWAAAGRDELARSIILDFVASDHFVLRRPGDI